MYSNIELNDIDRVLRSVTVVSWIPAFPFLLAHGILSEDLFPVLGLIPMTFSALTGGVHVSGRARFRQANFCADLIIACALIGMLIPSWVFMASWASRHTMLGTYGTMPMMVNFVIHSFFTFRDWRNALPQPSFCPHCHGNLAHAEPDPTSSRGYVRVEGDGPAMVEAESKTDIQEGPSYDHHDWKQPRPSTDDETARLVETS